MKHLWRLLLIYTLFVIVWGAFVRASGSGDGCGAHWPSCHGDFLLEHPSTKTLIEYIHRVSSGIYGLFVLALTGLVFLQKGQSKAVKWSALGVLFFTVLESLIGAKLVLSELVGQNTSHARSVVVMIHLTNTLLLIACNTLVLYFLDAKNSVLDFKKLLKFLPLALLFFLTGASGALAALGDTLYPSESLLQGFQMDFDPNSPLLIKLRGLHPIFAFLTAFFVIYTTDPKKNYGHLLIGLALVTLVVGVINLSFMAPIYLQLPHLFVALCFWILFLLYALLSSENKNLLGKHESLHKRGSAKHL